jgi:hypothetical protein
MGDGIPQSTPEDLREAPGSAPCAGFVKCEEGDLNPHLLGGNARFLGVACVVACHHVPSDGPLAPDSIELQHATEP